MIGGWSCINFNKSNLSQLNSFSIQSRLWFILWGARCIKYGCLCNKPKKSSSFKLSVDAKAKIRFSKKIF